MKATASAPALTICHGQRFEVEARGLPAASGAPADLDMQEPLAPAGGEPHGIQSGQEVQKGLHVACHAVKPIDEDGHFFPLDPVVKGETGPDGLEAAGANERQRASAG